MEFKYNLIHSYIRRMRHMMSHGDACAEHKKRTILRMEDKEIRKTANL